MNSELLRFYDFVSSQEDDEILSIPKVWNDSIQNPYVKKDKNTVKVNIFSFYKNLIDKFLKSKDNIDKDDFFDPSTSVIYCAVPRYSAAFDIYDNGKFSDGTFIRMLMLLPMLKNMGVNVLYLLPVNKHSNLFLKGDIGSPFSIVSFYELDPDLHDQIVEDMVDFTLEDEFKVLVQACHCLGIRVVMDFVPRVTGRDSDVIYDHPDWLYWIKKEYEEDFVPPEIPNMHVFEECTIHSLDAIYQAESTKNHLKKFTQPPNILDPEKWEEIKEDHKESEKNILELIEKKMGITTPPSHSDWVNDTQPVWTDATFWKIYMDNNPLVSKYIDKDQPPYVMFDTIKANKFPAKVPNKGLWDEFEKAILHYTTNFDLDGFRFDIGHTLPPVLLKRLFKVVKDIKPYAIFMSEDLFNRNHLSSVKTGYNIMLGSSWSAVANITKSSYSKFIKQCEYLKINVFACAETHDTPRIVTRWGGKDLARSLAFINNTLPNGTPFYLTGYEVNEKQPINDALANNDNKRNVKKALFNRMQIDWTSQDAFDMTKYLFEISKFRKKYKNTLKPFYFNFMNNNVDDVIAYNYDNSLYVFFNTNPIEDTVIKLSDFDLDFEKFEMVFNNEKGHKKEKLTSDKIDLSICGLICLKSLDKAN